MKKFIKWFILLVVLFIPTFSSADNLPTLNFGGNNLESIGSYKYTSDSLVFNGIKTYNLSSNYDFVCLLISRDSGSSPQYSLDNSTFSNVGSYSIFCLNSSTFYLKCPSGTCTVNAYYFKNGQGFVPSVYTSQQCQTEYNLIPISSVDQNYCTSNNLCPSTDPMTSLECQTEYNLIPINEVTANYCKLNFDLISPLDCPSGGSGSGDTVVFSNVYVNNVLYPGGADIYLNVNELLATDISYNSSLMYIDIDYSGDSDYIDGIVNINSYRPTSEDFTNIFAGGLVRLFPFIVIALFIAFVRKLIRKIFK